MAFPETWFLTSPARPRSPAAEAECRVQRLPTWRGGIRHLASRGWSSYSHITIFMGFVFRTMESLTASSAEATPRLACWSGQPMWSGHSCPLPLTLLLGWTSILVAHQTCPGSHREGHGFSRAANRQLGCGLQPLRSFAKVKPGNDFSSCPTLVFTPSCCSINLD